MNKQQGHKKFEVKWTHYHNQSHTYTRWIWGFDANTALYNFGMFHNDQETIYTDGPIIIRSIEEVEG